MADRNKGGRPLLFESAEELEQKINEYFESCYVVKEDKKGNIKRERIRPFTVSGLAAYLGCDRRTLTNYEEKDEFFPTIKKAKTKIEADIEEGALIGSYNPTASIFNLKNNFGWTDKQDIDLRSNNVNTNIDYNELPTEALEEITKAQSQEEILRIVSKYKK